MLGSPPGRMALSRAFDLVAAWPERNNVEGCIEYASGVDLLVPVDSGASAEQAAVYPVRIMMGISRSVMCRA
jgi:hypothetical protein